MGFKKTTRDIATPKKHKKSKSKKRKLETTNDAQKLITTDTTTAKETGKIAASVLATAIAAELKGKITFDMETELWYQLERNHWRRVKKIGLAKLVEPLLEQAKPNGYNDYDYNSLLNFLTRKLINEKGWTTNDNLHPMKNGVYNSKSGKLRSYKKKDRFRWNLPFDYIQNTNCENLKAQLMWFCANDHQRYNVLMAWLHFIVKRNNPSQQWLHFYGEGNNGKSFLLDIITYLVGEENTQPTNLAALEGDKFELANMENKALITSADQDQYHKPIPNLKKLVGNDLLRYERKGKDARDGGFKHNGNVVITSNFRNFTNDTTHGAYRRIFLFNCVSQVNEGLREKYAEFATSDEPDGARAIARKEIPALFNLIMSLETEAQRNLIRNPPEHIKREQLENLQENNSVLAWADEYLEICKPQQETPIGNYPEKGYSDSSRRLRQSQAKQNLYASYVLYCDGANKKPYQLTKFIQNLKTHLPKHGVETTYHAKKRNGSKRQISFFYCIRLCMKKDKRKSGLFEKANRSASKHR